MSKKYRLTMMFLSLLILCTIGWFITNSFDFLLNDFWFTSGLLLLVLLSLIDQPFFSKDSNIFVNAVTAALSLLLVPKDDRSFIYWGFLVIIVYLIVSSYIVMWCRNKELAEENKILQIVSRINRQLGRPEAIFSAFFLWGAIRQFTMESGAFNALLWFWIAFTLLNVPAIATGIEKTFKKHKDEKTEYAVGKILGVQSRNTFLVKLFEDRTESLKLGDFVEFSYSVDSKTHRGIVTDVYMLNQEQWTKVLTTREIDGLYDFNQEHYVNDYVYKETFSGQNEYFNRFVGLVYSESIIDKIRFIYNPKAQLKNGMLIELNISGHKVLYQIVQAVTKIEQLEHKNQTGFILGEAIQVGEWNNNEGKFMQFGWVPDVNTPIFFASDISVPKIEEDEFVVGNIPGTNYPVILNKEFAVTHHTAILGITGSGKSVFTRNLIKQIAVENTKAIVIDFTGEYKMKNPELKSIINEENSKMIFECLELIAKEKSKFPSQQKVEDIEKWETIVKENYYNSIKEFLIGNDNCIVFELAEIINEGNSLEYTRRFLWVLFNIAKTQYSFGKRVCVVLEEAHTIIPEVGSMGVSDNNSRAAVNSISQIALQGRKYNIGFIVIAQRTANVSKTVLTQCNSIISFQELDKTTCDFLSNYMGQDYIKSLSSLKPRVAIAMGKAFRANTPMIFEVPTIEEDN